MSDPVFLFFDGILPSNDLIFSLIYIGIVVTVIILAYLAVYFLYKESQNE
jgi:hypothetical protein